MATSIGNSAVVRVGETTVATAGTRVQVDAGYSVYGLSITAKAANTGQIYFGGNDVDFATNDGLDALDSFELEFEQPVDIGGFYVDADTDGEGIDFVAVTHQ